MRHSLGTPESGQSRGDMYEIAVFEDSIVKIRKDIMFISIPQEAVVIPENMDAIRAAMEMQTDGADGVAETNKYLELGKWMEK